LAINFEGDIRSQALMAMAGARRRIGFDSGGGGALLTSRATFDPRRHVTANAARLVATAFGVDADALERECMKEPRGESSPLVLDDETRTRATRLLEGRQSPFIGVHVSGGREIKQWPPWRFAEVALELVNETNGTIVLTGVSSDRAMIDAVAARLPSARVVDVAVALDLPVLAALLERLDVVITGDTGPMHLAEAVGTPVVAVFGPSDPRRYGPRLASSRTVRIDLPCSPCNRIRRPPERCVGHTPDCLDGVGVGVVAAAAREVLTIARASRVSERTPRA
jgi:ADP-heptose:LPS heptosyltransferase